MVGEDYEQVEAAMFGADIIGALTMVAFILFLFVPAALLTARNRRAAKGASSVFTIIQQNLGTEVGYLDMQAVRWLCPALRPVLSLTRDHVF